MKRLHLLALAALAASAPAFAADVDEAPYGFVSAVIRSTQADKARIVRPAASWATRAFISNIRAKKCQGPTPTHLLRRDPHAVGAGAKASGVGPDSRAEVRDGDVTRTSRRGRADKRREFDAIELLKVTTASGVITRRIPAADARRARSASSP